VRHRGATASASSAPSAAPVHDGLSLPVLR
jgi:hypothetical protein